MTQETGKWMLGIGIVLTGIGALIYFFHDKMQWFGKMPGDIAVEKENFKFYFPITTLIVLNVVIWVAVKIYQEMKK